MITETPIHDGATYDVVVVGARAAGAATAMLLARRGLRTLLLDQGAFGADTLSTHGLMRGGVMQLSRWGVLDDIIAAGTPPVKRTTFHYGPDPIVIPVKPAHGVDAFYAPRRTVLDPALVIAAAAAGADIHHRTPVIDLVRRGDRVTGVVVATPDGGFAEVHAPLVIGADGVRSTIARHVGAAVTRRGAHAAATTYGYWTDLPTDGYEFMFRANGSAGAFPTNDGRVCVFANASPERIGRGGVQVIRDVLDDGLPDMADRLSAATLVEGTRTWGGLPGYLRTPAGPGWALVGDAGYFKDPISAHGLTDALRDAELLARAVIDGDGDERATDAALQEYGALRDRLSIPLFDVVDEITAHDWDAVRIGELLVRLSASTKEEVEILTAIDAEVVA